MHFVQTDFVWKLQIFFKSILFHSMFECCIIASHEVKWSWNDFFIIIMGLFVEIIMCKEKQMYVYYAK